MPRFHSAANDPGRQVAEPASEYVDLRHPYYPLPGGLVGGSGLVKSDCGFGIRHPLFWNCPQSVRPEFRFKGSFVNAVLPLNHDAKRAAGAALKDAGGARSAQTSDSLSKVAGDPIGQSMHICRVKPEPCRTVPSYGQPTEPPITKLWAPTRLLYSERRHLSKSRLWGCLKP